MSLAKVLTEDFLKEIFTGVAADRKYCSDIDNIGIPGIYRMDSSTKNNPFLDAHGMVISLDADKPICSLIVVIPFLGQASAIALKMKWLSDWTAWRRINLT